MNRYPIWKYLLIVGVIVLALIYALPNLFGDVPAVQISPKAGSSLSAAQITRVGNQLKQDGLKYTKVEQDSKSAQFYFTNTDTQLKAKDDIKNILGNNYNVALNLASATPDYLKNIGGAPIKLGLDLRGGVHFLLQVDVASVVQHRIDGDSQNIAKDLQTQNIRYAGFTTTKKPQPTVKLSFRDKDNMDKAQSFVTQHYTDFSWDSSNKVDADGKYQLTGVIIPATLNKLEQSIIEQTMMTLRNRVNELGVSEAIVQQQGMNRIAVDLPGIQDAAKAQELIGKTATLEFHLVDMKNDPKNAAAGVVPMGSQLYTYHDQPILLQSPIILKGSAITSAYATMGNDGYPGVSIRLGGGGGEATFSRTTAENIGKSMAVVYVETQSTTKTVNGKLKISYKTDKKIINVATINDALGSSFIIDHMNSMDTAQNLALLLRAGALPTTVTIIESQTVGPSLGAKNIQMGIDSVILGLVLIMGFMMVYYRFMGLVANIGLLMNFLLMASILSIIGATLSLPGIAGMILSVGMAVDANVLIFERIREELRDKQPIQTAIHAGYERAMATIIDANVTTLIAALVLFGIGSGAVKGFAITLTIGVLASMFTSIMVTRALVNLIYGGRKVKKLSIGIKI